MKIAGSKILITGAASGIGRSLARTMSRQGGRMFLTDINAKGLAEVADELRAAGGEVCLAEPADVSDYAAMQKLAARVHEGFGALDVLVNNAGIAIFAAPEDFSHDQWTRIINVNLWGVIHGVECFLPEMVKARQGHVVNIASAAGLMGVPWQAAYSTTKFAVAGLSEVLRYDLARHNIHVTLVCPGFVNTGLVDTVEIEGDAKKIARQKKVMQKLAITPEKVADQIVAAVKKNKYKVITSPDIKLLYFMRNHGGAAYNAIMRLTSKYMEKNLGKG
ncbi:MAG: SDR family oxidoreductase [Thermodesulfobacteriota bacterium]